MKEKYIPGIYNYCDRWCERCTFTSRCRTFERTSDLMQEMEDFDSKKVFDAISQSFDETIQLLYKMANEKGIDLDAASAEFEKEIEERKKIGKAARNHPLVRQYSKYRELVTKFLKSDFEVQLNSFRDQIEKDFRMGVSDEQHVMALLDRVKDSNKIIRWYVFFIEAKLTRALHGKLEGEEWQEQNVFQKDSEGSAKIAMTGIDRTIEAWATLYDFMPSIEDQALNFLSILSEVKKNAEKEFPNAMNFKRPGFDD